MNPFLTDNVALIILFFFPGITDGGNGQIAVFQIHFNIFLLAAWQLDIQQITAVLLTDVAAHRRNCVAVQQRFIKHVIKEVVKHHSR